MKHLRSIVAALALLATVTPAAADSTATVPLLRGPLDPGNQLQTFNQVITSINAAFESFTGDVNVISSVLPDGASTSAKQDTTNTDLGPPGATACATDNGSCSLNALTQRVAQRLTSLITALGTVTVTNLPTTVDTNSGNKSSSTLRSVEATDAPAIANKGQAATGAAPPTGAVQVGAVASGATGGLMAALKTCDLHAKYDASDNGSITLVTGVASRKVYICGYVLATGGTATNLKLREGSDANCATNAADLTPAYQLPANAQAGALTGFWAGLATSTNAYFVCINASAGNAHQGELWYTIQ